MRIAALLLVLGLVGCGGGGPATPVDSTGRDIGPPASRTVYVVAVETLPPDRMAQYRNVGQDGWVEIRSDILAGHQLAVRTLMHELGHAMGLEHTTDGCLMDPSASSVQSTTPCASEVARATTTYPALTVYIGLNPGLPAAAQEACSSWNSACNHSVLNPQ